MISNTPPESEKREMGKKEMPANLARDEQQKTCHFAQFFTPFFSGKGKGKGKGERKKGKELSLHDKLITQKPLCLSIIKKKERSILLLPHYSSVQNFLIIVSINLNPHLNG